MGTGSFAPLSRNIRTDEWGGRMGTGSLAQDNTIGWILSRIFVGTGQRARHTGRVPLRLGSERPTGGGMSEGGIAGGGGFTAVD
jgi:hypothetical protein